MYGIIHRRDLNKGVFIALVAAAFLLGGILVAICCLCIYKLKRSCSFQQKSRQTSEDLAQTHSRFPCLARLGSSRTEGKMRNNCVFGYHMLEAATGNFDSSNKLEEEGLECVYRAQLGDNLIASVRRLDGDTQHEFENEIALLNKIRHRNIVALLGYCIHQDSRFLVYEKMQNGSLENQLHGPSRGSALTWPLRMKIALDVARGLEYLHELCNPPLIHTDLRSSNILLDSNFTAKLSGLGLAVEGGGTLNRSVELSGACCHVAPEYLSDGELTDKVDVFAFGVVLIELLTGTKQSSAESHSVVTWAFPQLTDKSKLPNIVDPVIRGQMEMKHLYQVAAVGVLCVQPEPSYRPLITDVLHSLIPLVPIQLGGSLRLH